MPPASKPDTPLWSNILNAGIQLMRERPLFHAQISAIHSCYLVSQSGSVRRRRGPYLAEDHEFTQGADHHHEPEFDGALRVWMGKLVLAGHQHGAKSADE